MAAFGIAAFSIYADDAFSGLHYMEQISSPNGEREVCIEESSRKDLEKSSLK